MTEERIMGQDAQIERSQHGYVTIRVKSMGLNTTAHWHENWDNSTTISSKEFNQKMDILEKEARSIVETEIRKVMTEALKRAKNRKKTSSGK